MPLSTQVRLLRAMRAILSGNVEGALPQASTPKPTFRNIKNGTALPRSSPEAQGLSSEFLEGFYQRLSSTRNAGAHAFIVLRHGHIVSDGYFTPYSPEIWHVTHSLCKTVTGTAVGLAISEGLFALDDTVADFFPDKTGLILSRRMRSITVRHLLTMSSGISYSEIDEMTDTGWLKGVFSSGVMFEPGSRFMYNSVNSFLLSALIQRTSGMTLMEYLEPRLFGPLGFGPVAFEKSSDGIEKGGWGMYMRPEDMAKLGQLYLQKGKWEGRQLVPAGWIEMATTTQITGPKGERYGFHLWIDDDAGNYIMNGMFGQYITVLPAQDIVLVMTAGSPYMFTDSPAHELVRQDFYTLHDLPHTLPENPVSLGRLRRTLAGLRFGAPSQTLARAPKRVPAHSRAERWNNLRQETLPAGDFAPFLDTTWRFDKNQGGLLPVVVQVMNNNFSSGVKAFHLQQEDTHTLLMLWEEDNGTICIPVGIGRPLRSHFYIGRESFEAAASCELRHDEDGNPVVKIQLSLLEHSSSRSIKLRRIGDRLQISMNEQPDLMVAVEGMMQQTQNTNSHDAKNDPTNPLMNFDYVNRKINQLCTPVVTGTPVESL